MPSHPRTPRARFALPFLLAGLGPAAWAPPATADLPSPAEQRAWIEGFAASPKGPFERIRWFCKDGTVLPPKGSCRSHGGGIQHGQLNDRARRLRAGGYVVANVLAELDAKEFVGRDADLFALEQILLERFLIGWDDGWIFRGARTYRGALQIEDEEAGSQAVVLAMLGDPAWREPGRFLLLRETVRLLPLPADEAAATRVRRQALLLAEKDPGFTPLRAKIHNQPDAGDAARVRAYAGSRGKAGPSGPYERLAADIDALFSGAGGAERAVALAPRLSGVPALSRSLDELGRKLGAERDPATRVAIAARLMALVRKHLPAIQPPGLASEALQLSVLLERGALAAGRRALAGGAAFSRDRSLELLDQTAEALYGAGLLDVGRLADLKRARKRAQLGTLAQPPAWSERSLVAQFGRAMDHLAPLEPAVRRYPQGRLEVSLVPFYRGVLAGLSR